MSSCPVSDGEMDDNSDYKVDPIPESESELEADDEEDDDD